MRKKLSRTFENVKSKANETASTIKTNVKEKKKKVISKEERNNIFITLIGQAVKIPGIKVNREAFLRERFKEYPDKQISEILLKGPVEAGVTKEILKKKSNKLIVERTAVSTGASFLVGIPGGLATAATVPADLLQFYAVTIRMAQEIAYLYGERDIYDGDKIDNQRVKEQLVLYIGVMMGSSGAIKVVQFMGSILTAQAAKKISQKALTKTFYYPVIEAICETFGVAVTKDGIARGVSKLIPIAGGAISGAITLSSMIPMAKRLVKVLEKAKFDYTQEDYDADWKDLTEFAGKLAIAEQSGGDNIEAVRNIDKEFENTSRDDNIKEEFTRVGDSSQIGDALKQIKEAKEMSDFTEKARALAREQFAGRTDKSGIDYFEGHLCSVAALVGSDEEKAVAYLHDLLEDTEYPEEKLRREFGDIIADAVLLMTHREKLSAESYLEYIKGLKASGNELAIAVKIADLTNNSDYTRLGVESPDQLSEKDRMRWEKYQQALEILEG